MSFLQVELERRTWLSYFFGRYSIRLPSLFGSTSCSCETPLKFRWQLYDSDGRSELLRYVAMYPETSQSHQAGNYNFLMSWFLTKGANTIANLLKKIFGCAIYVVVITEVTVESHSPKSFNNFSPLQTWPFRKVLLTKQHLASWSTDIRHDPEII